MWQEFGARRTLQPGSCAGSKSIMLGTDGIRLGIDKGLQMNNRFKFASILGSIWLALTAVTAFGFDHTHQDFGQTLSVYLVGGQVKYSELKAAVDSTPNHPFQRYLRALQEVDRAQFDAFTPNQQKAFLINAYNSLTIKLILDHYPVASIRDIGGVFSNPWKMEFFSLLSGDIKALDPIEHEFLRPRYKDYRIHAAVNCASRSCPELRAEPYVAEKLDRQLDEQMARWLHDPSRNQVDRGGRKILLSKIFDWYRDDFVAYGGSVDAVIQKHASDVFAGAIASKFSTDYLPYSWQLNEYKSAR